MYHSATIGGDFLDKSSPSTSSSSNGGASGGGGHASGNGNDGDADVHEQMEDELINELLTPSDIATLNEALARAKAAWSGEWDWKQDESARAMVEETDASCESAPSLRATAQ